MVRKVLYQDDAAVPPDPAQVFDVFELQVVTRTLTSPELLALYATPIELVPAEAGKKHFAIWALVIFDHGNVDYAFPAPKLYIQDVDGFQIELPAVLAEIQDSSASGLPLSAVAVVTPGVALEVAAEFAATDGDGTADVTVAYRTVDIS